jgi:hypothetical protein
MARRPPLSELSRPSYELQARGTAYRAMAATASTEDVRDALIRLAEAYEGWRDRNDAGGGGSVR